MIQVLIVEEQRMVRENMEAVFRGSVKYALAGSLPNAADAGRFCIRGEADLILMDTCALQDVNGFEACAGIRKRWKKIKIIITTSLAEYTYIEKARKAGADGFWYKDAGGAALMDMMDRTMAGEHIFPDKTPEVRLGLITSYSLTNAELNVLQTLMQSTGDEEAAKMLGCTKANVRWHVSEILHKTGYRTRTELLIAIAQKNLIVVTPDRAFGDDDV